MKKELAKDIINQKNTLDFHLNENRGKMKIKKLGQLLKNRRNELSINQIDLSEISGVALHTISDIESGKGNPTFAVMMRILDVLGMDIKIKVKDNE